MQAAREAANPSSPAVAAAVVEAQEAASASAPKSAAAQPAWAPQTVAGSSGSAEWVVRSAVLVSGLPTVGEAAVESPGLAWQAEMRSR